MEEGSTYQVVCIAVVDVMETTVGITL